MLIHHPLHTLQEASGNTVRRNQARKSNPHVLPRPSTLHFLHGGFGVIRDLWTDVRSILIVVDSREEGDADDTSEGSAGHGDGCGCAD